MQLESHLERKDYGLVLGGFVLSILSAFVLPAFVDDAMRVEAYTRFLVAAVVSYGIYSIYMSIEAWAGELARYLQLIGIGLGILMVAWIPHIGWHILGNPEWLGLNPTFWITLFHSLTLLAFLTSTYGFHLFWKKA